MNIINRSVCAVAGALFLSLASQAHAGQIAFSSARPENVGGGREIYVMNEDGTGTRRVTSTNPTPPEGVGNFTALADQPAFSPDGTKIAFIGSSSDFSNFDIYVVNSDGTNRVQLTQTADSESHPAWSPDGTRLTFSRNSQATGTGSSSENYRSHIYVMNADGSGAVKIADVGNDSAPSWSPDGTHIAFSSFANDGSSSRIYTVQPDGTQLTAITPGGFSTAPSWSPNSQLLTFSSYDGNTGYYQVALLSASDINGTPTILTNGSSQGAFNPVFKSDGNSLVFQASPDNDPEIYSIDLNGANLQRLTTNPGYDGFPSVTAATPAPVSPVATSDSYTIVNNGRYNTPYLYVTAPGVLSNDQAVPGTTLRATLVSPPKNAFVFLKPDGTFFFLPRSSASRVYTFTYRITDSNNLTSTATITVNVNSRNK